jgi:AcrR family transcriptional regulator
MAASSAAKAKPAPPTRIAQRKRDPERTRKAILDAAVAEFSQRGYAGARVDGIARRAHVNKRMLYHYFGGKDRLYLAVLEGRYAAIRTAELDLDLTHREPRDAMRELVLFTWRYFLAHPEFLSILATENQHHARFLKQSQTIVGMNSPLISALGEVLEHGRADGSFRAAIDPIDLYISIASLGAFYLSNRWTLSTIFSRDLDGKAALGRWGEHIVEMVMSFLDPRAATVSTSP